MTQPEQSQVFEGTDVEVDPDDAKAADEPATSDPEQLTDGGAMGGTGGKDAGGAG